jgi:hypothetical protein
MIHAEMLPKSTPKLNREPASPMLVSEYYSPGQTTPEARDRLVRSIHQSLLRQHCAAPLLQVFREGRRLTLWSPINTIEPRFLQWNRSIAARLPPRASAPSVLLVYLAICEATDASQRADPVAGRQTQTYLGPWPGASVRLSAYSYPQWRTRRTSVCRSRRRLA